jgi:hypothetical protein
LDVPHFSLSNIMRNVLHQYLDVLDKASMAWSQGKALEQLRERTARLGILEMPVYQAVREENDGTVCITLHSSVPLSGSWEYDLHRIVERINRRFGTHLHVETATGERP